MIGKHEKRQGKTHLKTLCSVETQNLYTNFPLLEYRVIYV